MGGVDRTLHSSELVQGCGYSRVRAPYAGTRAGVDVGVVPYVLGRLLELALLLLGLLLGPFLEAGLTSQQVEVGGALPPELGMVGVGVAAQREAREWEKDGSLGRPLA